MRWIPVLLLGLMVIGCDNGDETVASPTSTSTKTVSDIPDLVAIGPSLGRDNLIGFGS